MPPTRLIIAPGEKNTSIPFPGSHCLTLATTVTYGSTHQHRPVSYPYRYPHRQNICLHRLVSNHVPQIINIVVKPACIVRRMLREPPLPPSAHGSNGPNPPSRGAWLLPPAPRRLQPRQGRDAHRRWSNCSLRARIGAGRLFRRCARARHTGQGGKAKGSVSRVDETRKQETTAFFQNRQTFVRDVRAEHAECPRTLSRL